MPHVTPHDLASPHVIPAYSCAGAAIFRLQECCMLSVMGIHFKHGRRRPSERQQKLQRLGQIDVPCRIIQTKTANPTLQ